MDYEGMVIRPPSEAYSILLQVTVGCSHNKCVFCGTYKDKRFRIKSDERILKDIRFASQYCKRQDRVFLMDGDAMIIPQKRLVWILERIQEYLPWVKRVGLYANAKSIKMKSDEELRQLKELGLGIVYLGVETGHPELLKKICKGTSRENLILQGKRIKQAGIRLSVTVLLGIGGTEMSNEHARETGTLLTEMDPNFVGALTVMVLPNTSLGQEYAEKKFQPLSVEQLLIELGEMLAATRLSRGLFYSNHASNYLPIKVRFPEGKEPALALIQKALKGKVGLRPEWMRAL
ncbi:MAG: B12-binding domain-containing radical SAM protein [Deltaproteobacteria bacterium]|nr:B12-binding domain-containing radical SAM protein [Deltaproteobacteria bacterium]